MQKNLPKYTPEWVERVSMWAESSHRNVSYALCNDRRTLLWFANQRAIEYHPTLGAAGGLAAPDPPRSSTSTRPRDRRSPIVAQTAKLVRQALDDSGLQGAVKTSGAKGVHVFVPLDGSTLDRGRGRGDPGPGRAGRAAGSRSWRPPPSSGRTAGGRVLHRLDPGRGRHGRRPSTARGCGPACRSRSRCPGTTSTGWSRRLHHTHGARRCWAPATRGLRRCPRRSA